MRLLYQHVVGSLSKKNCALVIDHFKSRVATGLQNQEPSEGRVLPTDVIYNFITTSRPVENWLQNLEESVYRMRRGKIPIELSVVIGGYGAGKSHIKEYLFRKKIPNVEFLEIETTSLLLSDMNPTSTVYDVFSLAILRTRAHLDALYEKIYIEGEAEGLSARLREDFIDNEFINIFSRYGELRHDNHQDFKPLQDYISKKGAQIFLPLMRLYKKYLGVSGICIFIDEFEILQHLTLEKRDRFIDSIREFYDLLASSIFDQETPSFKMIILCTLSYWNEIISETHFRALETRVHLFEIPPLVEDEIIALAEKLHVLYKKSGNLESTANLDFARLPHYLVRVAGIQEPITPRFVISQIISIIENPEDYIRYLYQL